MAQENFNVSLPNDDLGDALRDAFIKQQSMNTELYTTKVDKVVGKDLSTNDFTNALKAKLDNIENFADANVQSDWLQTDDTADDYIKNKPNFAGLVPDGFTLAETTLVDQEFTINAAQWYVNGQLNILPFSFPALSFEIDLADTGLQRSDLFYGTNVGTIERIIGVEGVVAVEPTLPPNCVRLTAILTNDTESEPPAPIDFSGYILKNSFAYLPLSSLGGAPVAPVSLNFITTDGDGVTGFSGFQSGVVFIGQRMIIRNDKTTDFELTPAGLFDFTFDQNYTIKAGDNIEFDFTASGFRQVGIDAISRKGTADGFPIVGDLELSGENVIQIKQTVGDFVKKIYFSDDPTLDISVQGESSYSGFSIDGEVVDVVGKLRGASDISETDLAEPQIYTQRSYVLGVPKSANFTAETNGRYLTTATLTITDTEVENYFVQVQSGTCTIGGVAYVAGDWVWRVGANSYKINGSGGGGGGTWGSITGTLADQTDLQNAFDAKQNNSIYITSDTTAVNNGRYIANGTLTVSDIVSPDAGSNYEVVVRGGAVTIDGVAFDAGSTIKRVHNGTSWQEYYFNPLPLVFTGASNLTTSRLWNNRIVKIVNTAPITVTLNDDIECSGNQESIFDISFVSGNRVAAAANGTLILSSSVAGSLFMLSKSNASGTPTTRVYLNTL